jgi:hypothetical protein
VVCDRFFDVLKSGIKMQVLWINHDSPAYIRSLVAIFSFCLRVELGANYFQPPEISNSLSLSLLQNLCGSLREFFVWPTFGRDETRGLDHFINVVVPTINESKKLREIDLNYAHVEETHLNLLEKPASSISIARIRMFTTPFDPEGRYSTQSFFETFPNVIDVTFRINSMRIFWNNVPQAKADQLQRISWDGFDVPLATFGNLETLILLVDSIDVEDLPNFLPACNGLSVLGLTIVSDEDIFVHRAYGYQPGNTRFDFEQSIRAIPTQLKRLFLSVDIDNYDYNPIEKLAVFSALANRLPNLEALMVEGFKTGKEFGSIMVAKFPKLKICMSLDEQDQLYRARHYVAETETGGWMWSASGKRVQRFNNLGKFWARWSKAKQKYF